MSGYIDTAKKVGSLMTQLSKDDYLRVVKASAFGKKSVISSIKRPGSRQIETIQEDPFMRNTKMEEKAIAHNYLLTGNLLQVRHGKES